MKKVLISIDWSENAEKAFDCTFTYLYHFILHYSLFQLKKFYVNKNCLKHFSVDKNRTLIKPNRILAI